MPLAKLTIHHNHGFCTLLDVTLEPYQRCDAQGRPDGRIGHVAVGTVSAGGEMSRLFHATKYREYTVGAIKEWDLYGKADTIRETPDGHEINMVTCG